MDEATIRAIAGAVERQGGDYSDVEDLLDTWEHLHADKGGRAARLHYKAAHPACRCVDGGLPGDDGRCSRCCGMATR